MEKAQKTYNEKKYTEAIQLYAQLLKQGYEVPEVYYNIGNCYFKNNQITKAIYFYEKALKLAPYDNDIQYNLSLANQYTTDKIKRLSPFWLTQGVNYFFNLFSADGWARISTIAFIGLLVFVLLFLFTHQLGLKRVLLYFSVFLLFLSSLSFWGAYHQASVVLSHKTAIIFEPTLNIKSAPSEDGTNLMVIHEGLKVSICDSINNWYKIVLPDGNEGWVKKNTLKRI
jgi:tetratricopeptide (TPR) repeat protein